MSAETDGFLGMRGAWGATAKHVWAALGRDHVGLISAGVAFYGLLALFPAITALMAVAGIAFDPAEIADQMERVSAVVPESAAEIVLSQASAVSEASSGGLGLAMLVALTIAVVSASKGVASLMEGLNVAYDTEESRGMVHLWTIRLALTAALVVGMVAGLAATLLLPTLLSLIDLGPTTEALIGLARWAVLLCLTTAGILVVYRMAPDAPRRSWRQLLPGAVIACALWLAASVGFSVYVENFGSYNETFGTLGGVIVLLMWLWLSAYVLLLGAEINIAVEARDRA